MSHRPSLHGGMAQPGLSHQMRSDRAIHDAEHLFHGGRLGGQQEAQREGHAQ